MYDLTGVLGLDMPWFKVQQYLRQAHLVRTLREGKGLTREMDIDLQKESAPDDDDDT